MERVFGDFPWVLRVPLPELAPLRDLAKAIVLSEFQARMSNAGGSCPISQLLTT